MVDHTFSTPADRLDAVSRLVEVGMKHAASFGVREVHLGVDQRRRGWLRKLLGMRGAFDDPRHHVVLSAAGRLED